MEFVLVDESVVSAYTERVSRIARGVGNLQEKMHNIMSNAFGENYEELDNSTNTQTMDRSEPVTDLGYDESPMENFDIATEDAVSQIDEVDQITETSFNEPINQSFEETSQTSDEELNVDYVDLDIDLDAMLEGISFDDDELQM